MSDSVDHPTHYNAGTIECIDAIASATIGLTGIEAVCTGNIIKYTWRWKNKGKIEDLRKARWYLDRLITHLSKDDNESNPVSGEDASSTT